jgi:endonuclease-3
MNAAQRRELFARLKAANPKPATELKYGNTFQLLVAVVLSAQATDKGVNLATRELFKVVKKPQDVLDMGLRKLKSYVKTIGLYNTKAENIMKACRILVEQYKGKVPHDREALESLPGVGRKTANVILNTAFGDPVIAVDTHIFRVANRTGLAPGKNVREVEEKLMDVVPDEFKHDAHHWLILHGRYTCLARKPRCGSCPIFDICEYDSKVEE